MKHNGILAFLCLILLSTTACEEKKESIAKSKPIAVYKSNKTKVEAYDYEGLQYYLNQDDDSTYVINFWATWCLPCVEELPHFEKLGKEYKDKNVQVLLVSLDMVKNAETKLVPFVKEKKLKSEVILLQDTDANTWIPKIDKTWSGAIPATLIYNKNKRAFYEQSFTYEELKEAVDAVIE